MAIVEGFLSQHMAAHIATMNLLAPAVALWTTRQPEIIAHPATGLAAATIAQIALLWFWHSPPVLGAAAQDAALMAAMHGSLFLAALWFWSRVIRETQRRNWTPIAGLLVTGKLFCLLGVLLTFAPRALYWQAALLQACFGASPLPIEDQQFAGLLMLASCPVVFVGAAIVAAHRWIGGLAQQAGWAPGMETR